MRVVPSSILPLFSLTATIAACTATSSAPDASIGGDRSRGAAPVGTCLLVALESGREVCLSSEPVLFGAVPTSVRDAVAEAPLTAPDFDARTPRPPRVDLRAQHLDGCLRVRDQGACAWCAVAVTAAALDALYCAEGCVPSPASMPDIYASANGGRITSCSENNSYLSLFTAITTGRVLPESVWPYTGGARSMMETRPSEDASRGRRRLGATGYVEIEPDNGAFIERIKRVLASGRTVATGSAVCLDRGWSTGRAVIQAPTGPCGRSGREHDGYHAYLLVGYDDATSEFTFLNSFGTSWGSGGYGRITYRFAQRELLAVGYLSDADRGGGGCDGPSADAGAPTMLDGGVAPSSGPAERCAALIDCATCASTSGCVHCDGRCVEASVDGAGPAGGSCSDSYVAVPSECPLPADACTALASCGECASASGCAWCGARARCLAWPEGAGTCTESRIATSPMQCNDALGACECAAHVTCDGCAEAPGCGWCAEVDQCVPTTVSCASSLTTDRAHCAASGAPATSMCEACVALAGCGFCASGGASGGRCRGGDMVGTERGEACAEPGWLSNGESCAALDAGAPVRDGDAGTRACRDDGRTCGIDEDCCEGLECVLGSCRDPASCGIEDRDCAAGVDCCGGLSCLPRTFGGGRACCVGFAGGLCTVDDDCCGEMTCVERRCAERDVGESCAHDNDCAARSACPSGTCATAT